MSHIRRVTAGDVAGRLSWSGITAALRAGHNLAKPELGDQFLQQGGDTLLSRAAWVPGLGMGVKSVTVMPGNAEHGLPSVHGAMLVFDGGTGVPKALIDSDVVTWWKTAGDSVLGAKLLARPEPLRLLIIGAGVVAKSLIEAYAEIFPTLSEITIWNRTQTHAEALAESAVRDGYAVSVAADLEREASKADIICTATLSSEPVLKGEWVPPGTHVDLIGAFKADMREADDALLQKSTLFVDSRNTTMDHIGELMIPLAAGTISREDIRGDLYDLVAGRAGRSHEAEITFYKNGGGAHLDLMTANYILGALGD